MNQMYVGRVTCTQAGKHKQHRHCTRRELNGFQNRVARTTNGLMLLDGGELGLDSTRGPRSSLYLCSVTTWKYKLLYGRHIPERATNHRNSQTNRGKIIGSGTSSMIMARQLCRNESELKQKKIKGYTMEWLAGIAVRFASGRAVQHDGRTLRAV